MINVNKVGWGSYKDYEGAFYYGSRKFKMPESPTPDDLVLDVVTRTEGSSPDAVNAYDRCIISVGYIQWCEAAYFLTSKLLGHIASHDLSLLDELKPAMLASNAEFRKNGNGKWRFHFKDSRGEIDTKIEQKQLFLLHSTGHKGTWDRDSMNRVKLWVSCLANTLIQQEADRLQIQFTVPRLKSFASLSAKNILWGEKRVDTGFTGALRAAYLSFASNLPAVASKHLDIAVKASSANKWSPDWCISILKELTFGPNISIYPSRYDKIRPALERNYGVILPDFSKELLSWQSRFKSIKGVPQFTSVREIQTILMRLGYDIGPSKVDGRMGSKTKEAIHTFQNLHKLLADSIVGPITRDVFVEEWKKLDKIGKNE